MHSRLLLLGAVLLSCTSAPTPNSASPFPLPPFREYSGVYISTPDEDRFTPCGVAVAGDGWSLRFRDDERKAPFLKKVTALNGYAPLTHFIRVRGRLGPVGSHPTGFQTQELAVDSVLDVKETLEPCPGFGVPASWSGLPVRLGTIEPFALNTERGLAAVMDQDGQTSIWSTESRALVRKLSAIGKVKRGTTVSGPMILSDDGKLLAVGGVDGLVRVWSVLDGRQILSLALKDSAASASGMAKIPLAPNEWRPPPPPNSYTPARDLTFNRRGTMLITRNLFSTIVWSTKTGEKLIEFDRGNNFRSNVFFVGDEGLITIADSGRMVMRSYIEAAGVTRPGTRARWVEHVTTTSDGRLFAVHGPGDSVYLWSVAKGPGPALSVPGFVTGAMSFSPDGSTLAIAGGSAGLYLFDTRTGAPVKSFHNFPGALSRLWFSADGKSIITRSNFDDRLRVVYVDPSVRPKGEQLFDDSLTTKLPLGPPPSTTPRTIGGIVTDPSHRGVGNADVAIMNGDAPDSVIARTTTSAGGYFSFNGIRFRHILIRVRAMGFATAVKYIHVMRWENDGPWGIELTPLTRLDESGADAGGTKLHTAIENGMLIVVSSPGVT